MPTDDAGRTIAVGDIHGCLVAFDVPLLEACNSGVSPLALPELEGMTRCRPGMLPASCSVFFEHAVTVRFGCFQPIA